VHATSREGKGPEAQEKPSAEERGGHCRAREHESDFAAPVLECSHGVRFVIPVVDVEHLQAENRRVGPFDERQQGGDCLGSRVSRGRPSSRPGQRLRDVLVEDGERFMRLAGKAPLSRVRIPPIVFAKIAAS